MLINTILPGITLLFFPATFALPALTSTAAAAPAELIQHGGFPSFFSPAESLTLLPTAREASSRSTGTRPSALSASIKASAGESARERLAIDSRAAASSPPIAAPDQIHLPPLQGTAPSPLQGIAPSPPISIPGRQDQAQRLPAAVNHEMASPSSSFASSQSELMFPIDFDTDSAISPSSSFDSSRKSLRENLIRGVNPFQSPPRDSPSSPPTLHRKVIIS